MREALVIVGFLFTTFLILCVLVVTSATLIMVDETHTVIVGPRTAIPDKKKLFEDAPDGAAADDYWAWVDEGKRLEAAGNLVAAAACYREASRRAMNVGEANLSDTLLAMSEALDPR